MDFTIVERLRAAPAAVAAAAMDREICPYPSLG
jgi:hypothetical protein